MFSLPAHMPLPAGVTVEELQLCCDVPSMLAPQEADAHQERTLYDLPDYYTTSPYFETPQVFAVCYQHLHAGAALHKAGIAYGGLQVSRARPGVGDTTIQLFSAGACPHQSWVRHQLAFGLPASLLLYIAFPCSCGVFIIAYAKSGP
jgi:hypothetical protein